MVLTKALKARRFLGLAVVMAVGLHQFEIVAVEGSVPGAPADD